MRSAAVERTTSETSVAVKVELDGAGSTGSPPVSAFSTTCWSNWRVIR